MSGLVELGRYPNGALAHIVKGRLEAAGIPAVCFDTGINIAEGAGLIIPVRVMVLDVDLTEAREVLAEDVAEPDGESAA